MNTQDHITYMIKARHAQAQSEHPTHKVGATLVVHDDDHVTAISAPNFWPQALQDTIGRNEKLGNASTTIHAEIAVFLSASRTQDGTLYITHLPCPNCSKAIVEAGIKNIVIDSETHNTPLGQKIKPFFDDVSLMIFCRAGVGVFEINIDTQEQTTIAAPNSLHDTLTDDGITITPIDHNNSEPDIFFDLVSKHESPPPFASCIARADDNRLYFVMAQLDLTPGLTQGGASNIAQKQKKYTPESQPLNHLLMTNARYGLKIENGFLYSSQCPTSREFVNIIGAKMNTLYIGNLMQCRDEKGLQALESVKQHKILNIMSVTPP